MAFRRGKSLSACFQGAAASTSRVGNRGWEAKIKSSSVAPILILQPRYYDKTDFIRPTLTVLRSNQLLNLMRYLYQGLLSVRLLCIIAMGRLLVPGPKFLPK